MPLKTLLSLLILFPSGARSAPQSQGSADGTELTAATTDLKEKAADHLEKARNLLRILNLQLEDLKKKNARLDDLYSQGLLSSSDLEREKAAMGDLQVRVESQTGLCEAAEMLLAELETPLESSFSPGSDHPWATRSSDWFSELANFFWHRFGYELPISALGQTPTHDRLGFDHSDGIDLALTPGSAQGQAVLDFLKQRSLPFQAFEFARDGSSTGAHIHVGPGSTRLLR